MDAPPLSSPPVRKAYADCAGGQLHLLYAGEENRAAAPLLLFHQNPSTSEEYRHLIAAMATDRPVYAFDTPGYGMSDRTDGPLSIAGYAERFVEAIDSLRIAADATVDVFGFHTGTFLAIEVARLLGERCGRIALAGIPFRPPAYREERLAEIHAVKSPTDDGDAIFDRLRWLWSFMVAQRSAGLPIERAADMFMERARPLHRYWWAYDAVWRYPVEERLAAIRQPALLLVPDEMLAEQSRAAAALIPDRRLIELPDLHRDIFEPAGGVARIAAELRTFLI